MRGERGQMAEGDTEQIQHSPMPVRRFGGALPTLAGIVAGLVVCALALLAFRLTASPPPPDPAPLAHTVCVDLMGQRYEAMYALLSPDLQAQGSVAQFAASQRELDRLAGPVRSCQPSVVNSGDGVASFTLSLQRGSATPVSAQMTLAATHGAWRVSSFDQNV